MERYSDEELLYLVRCDNEWARECLLETYYYRILQWMTPFDKYQYLGIELEDFVQNAMINFWNAVVSYRDDVGTSLYAYVKATVLYRTYSEIAFKKGKRLSKDGAIISLNEYINRKDGYLYEEVIEDPAIDYQPEKIFKIRETTTHYLTHLYQKTTPIERAVMDYFIQGYNEKEISEKLDIPIKSVYNAVYRGHKKVSH